MADRGGLFGRPGTMGREPEPGRIRTRTGTQGRTGTGAGTGGRTGTGAENRDRDEGLEPRSEGLEPETRTADGERKTGSRERGTGTETGTADGERKTEPGARDWNRRREPQTGNDGRSRRRGPKAGRGTADGEREMGMGGTGREVLPYGGVTVVGADARWSCLGTRDGRRAEGPAQPTTHPLRCLDSQRGTGPTRRSRTNAPTPRRRRGRMAGQASAPHGMSHVHPVPTRRRAARDRAQMGRPCPVQPPDEGATCGERIARPWGGTRRRVASTCTSARRGGRPPGLAPPSDAGAGRPPGLAPPSDAGAGGRPDRLRRAIRIQRQGWHHHSGGGAVNGGRERTPFGTPAPLRSEFTCRRRAFTTPLQHRPPLLLNL